MQHLNASSFGGESLATEGAVAHVVKLTCPDGFLMAAVPALILPLGFKNYAKSISEWCGNAQLIKH